MEDRTLLLSIRPKYAQRIFKGEKTVELRRVRPRVNKGTRVLLYVSSPVKALSGTFVVEEIIELSPNELWSAVRSRAGVTRDEFDEYYSGASVGYAIFFTKVVELQRPIGLQRLRERWPDFSAPQSYCYVRAGKARLVAEH